jgi:hypothetical protein
MRLMIYSAAVAVFVVASMGDSPIRESGSRLAAERYQLAAQAVGPVPIAPGVEGYSSGTGYAAPENPFARETSSRYSSDGVEFYEPTPADGADEEEERSLSPAELAAAGALRALIGEQPIRRRPTDVLNGYAHERGPGDPETAAPRAPDPDNVSQAPEPTQGEKPLASRLLLGDWVAIEKRLAALPQQKQPAAYTGLLGMLTDDGWGFFLPAEVLALADAAPGPIDEKQAAALGNLLQRSLQHAETPGNFLAGLMKSKRLGPADDATRTATVRVLMAARLLEEAKRYLPALDSADTARKVAAMNLHADYQAAVAKTNGDEAALVQAWELTQAVIALPDAMPADRKAAISRALVLAPRLPDEKSTAWMASMLRKYDGTAAFKLLGTIAARSPQAFQRFAVEGRVESLKLAQLAGEQLLVVRGERFNNGGDLNDAAPADARWPLALAMLAHGWINEAQKSLGGDFRRITIAEDDKYPSIPIEALLALAPSGKWRAAIDRDMADHLAHLTGELAARAGNREVALAIIRQLVPRQPQIAKTIAESVLVPPSNDDERYIDIDDHRYRHLISSPSSHHSWASGTSGMSPSYVSHSVTTSIHDYSGEQSGPPTRGRQVQRLAELEAVLAEFRAAGVPPVTDEKLLVAFGKCHSPAEVMRREDIERIFGPLDTLTPTAAMAIVSSMRENLAGMWRDPSIQQQAGTKRTPKDLVEEINRGYLLGTTIAEQAATRTTVVAPMLVLASVRFDYAEFLYGQQIELKTYIALREASFTAFSQAAERFAAKQTKSNEQSDAVEAYQLWFQAALGASDMAYLTKQDEPDKTQVQKIAAAISALPAESADFHRKLFAERIAASLMQTPPALKPHVVRQALAIVGGHAAAKSLEERLEYYDELLGEVEFVARVDGSDRVGVKRPFGVHVAIRGTQPVFRENSLFVGLVAPPATAAESEPRRALEREIREKFSERFDVEALAFYPPMTRPRSLERAGWQERPLAYVVLRAKDESVDRLPPMQIDIDFADGPEPVRLPIRTAVVLLDARSAAPRPAEEMRLRQTLDDRQVDDGSVALEVVATARGVPPGLDAIMNEPEHVTGFEPGKTHNHGVSIVTIGEGESEEPLVERRWTVDYVLASGSRPANFRFPAASNATVVQELQRYADADIVASEPIAELRYSTIASARRWIWGAAAVLAVVAFAVAGVLLWRKRRLVPVVATNYHWPEKITAFNLLAILERMRRDATLRLGELERSELSATIAGIERQFFAPAPTRATDLEAIRRRWRPYTPTSNGHSDL